MARARNSKLEGADRVQRENSVWTGPVVRAQTDPARLDRLIGLRARIAAITPAQLQAAAVKYLTPQRRLELKIVAAETPPATVASK
jgi:zinc protease